jgi:superfamily II DNA or RNA helicase
VSALPKQQDDLFTAPSTRRFPPPRAFQEVAHRELRNGYVAGHQRQVLMAPTGAGKTYLGLRICDEALQRGKRVMFVCDRKTLINQTSAAADAYGMPIHGVIQAAHPRMALWRPFQIASAQTLAARGVDDDFDVIIVDEAHTLYDATTKLVTETKAAVVGLSATPFTRGLGAVYTRVVNAATMDELVKLGVLTPMRVLSCVRPDMTGAKTTGGEWTAKEAGARGMELIGDVVGEWLKHGENRKTICFGPTVAHCEQLREKFEAAGVGCALFTGETDDNERKQLLADYRNTNSRIRVLVSVEALAKGFDVPDVSCVIDCRPLRKSLSTFVQMVGRGLRQAPGKTDCLLLDHSGNIQRFADDFSDLYFNGLSELDAGEKLDREVRKDEEHEAKSCPSCGFSPCGKRCVRCGFETRRVSMHEHQQGEAVELDILGTSKTSYAKTLPELYAALATYEKGRAARRVESGRPPGNPKGAAAHRFKELTGKWPGRDCDFDAAPHVVATRALQGKLRSLEIAFAKSRRAS